METTLEPKMDVNHNEIARLAQQLWEQAGRPSGQDLDFWLKAETQLRSPRKTAVANLPMSEAKPRAATSDTKFNPIPIKTSAPGSSLKERPRQ